MTEESGFQVDAESPRHYHRQTAPFMQPFVDALVGASVAKGNSVLDVACGTGAAATAASDVVGPSGSVVASDINESMLSVARAVSSDRHPSITWDLASAADLPYSEGSFDAVICQQGVQFFPEPSAGLREMRRVARSTGVIAVTVWNPLADSPYFHATIDMLATFCGLDRAEMEFWSTADELAGWFTDAGLNDPMVTTVEVLVDLPPVERYVPAHIRALPWQGTFFEMTDDSRTEAVAYVADRLSSYRTEAGLSVPFSSHLAVKEL